MKKNVIGEIREEKINIEKENRNKKEKEDEKREDIQILQKKSRFW